MFYQEKSGNPDQAGKRMDSIPKKKATAISDQNLFDVEPCLVFRENLILRELCLEPRRLSSLHYRFLH
jgi:hypothetical protein